MKKELKQSKFIKSKSLFTFKGSDTAATKNRSGSTTYLTTTHPTTTSGCL
ncbi:hypothetical protein [Sphingobacterium detergens]|nr:hypothetical protein [Sphingobacterium detergens]